MGGHARYAYHPGWGRRCTLRNLRHWGPWSLILGSSLCVPAVLTGGLGRVRATCARQRKTLSGERGASSRYARRSAVLLISRNRNSEGFIRTPCLTYGVASGPRVASMTAARELGRAAYLRGLARTAGPFLYKGDVLSQPARHENHGAFNARALESKTSAFPRARTVDHAMCTHSKPLKSVDCFSKVPPPAGRPARTGRLELHCWRAQNENGPASP